MGIAQRAPARDLVTRGVRSIFDLWAVDLLLKKKHYTELGIGRYSGTVEWVGCRSNIKNKLPNLKRLKQSFEGGTVSVFGGIARF